MSPYVRDSKTATNTSIKTLLAKSPIKNRIGLDMSIIIVKAMRNKNATNIHSLFHSDPLVPIPDLTEKVIQEVQQFATTKQQIVNEKGKSETVELKAFDKIFCVFDGATHPLKERHAHQVRYSRSGEKRDRLEEIYNTKKEFTSKFDEDQVLKEVRNLRCELMHLRADILHDILEALKKKFGNQVIIIGAPFEADHQLAALFHLNIIDYVFSDDSDIICCGADLITNVQKNGKCWFISFQDLLSKRLPCKFGTKAKKWSHEMLRFACSFLGNDFLKRASGNGPGHVKEFIDAISEGEHGGLKSYEYIYNFILNNALVPTKKSKSSEIWFSAQYRRSHLKLWLETQEMFLHGPVFFPESCSSTVPIREAILNQEVRISLGSMTAGRSNGFTWSIDTSKSSALERELGRERLLGFSPDETLRDQLGMRQELDGIGSYDSVTLSPTYKNCFFFINNIWSKKGLDIKPLPIPTDNAGNQVFHVAILNFDHIPPIYFSFQQLSFWLANRQIKTPTDKNEAVKLATVIHENLGDMNPIPRVLMRGKGGYIEPELLQPKESIENIKWLEGNDLLKVLKSPSFCTLNENFFTSFFGKRNGSRLRAQKHVEGGSFDLKMVKCTWDLRHKLSNGEHENLLVITSACAPSQKLKEGNKEAFYTVRLAIQLDANKNFVSIHKHPITHCSCPNGCIACSHIAATLLLCHALRVYDTVGEEGESVSLNFDQIYKLFPQPVNEVLAVPIPVTEAFALRGTLTKDKTRHQRRKHKKKGNKKKKKNKIGKEGAADEESENHNENEENIDMINECDFADELEEFARVGRYVAIDGIVDSSVIPPYSIVGNIEEWVKSIKVGRNLNGRLVMSAEHSRTEVHNLSQLKESKMFKATQLVVMERFEKKMRALYKSRNEIGNTNTPVIFSMLNATQTKRAQLKTELKEEIKMVDLQSCLTIRNNNNDNEE